MKITKVQASPVSVPIKEAPSKSKMRTGPRFDAGYTAARISAGMAEAAELQCIEHSHFELGVAFAMKLHLIASTPNFTMANQLVEYNILLDDALQDGPLKMDGPYAYVPEGHGIGVQISDEKIEKYHEMYVKEVYEKGFERETENHYYAAMFMRPYFRPTDHTDTPK